MQVTTIKSAMIGLELWDVLLRTTDGKQYKLRTVDADIGQIGFSGEVKSQESDGVKYVVQAAGAAPVVAAPAPRPKGPAEQKDDRIRAQWAIGQAMTKVTISGNDTGTEAGRKKLAGQLVYVESLAKVIYDMVDKIKGGTEQ